MVVAIGFASVVHADPKRPVPDYDGRGNPDREADSWALWIPRVLLSPIYLVNEYVLRRPLGAFVRHAEREHWADTVEEVFTFGSKGNNIIYPTALFDFALLPSVGIFLKSEDLFVDGNTLRVHAATWGRPWIDVTVADQLDLDRHDVVELRFAFRRAEDNLFFGIGPDVTKHTESRYGLEKLEGTASYDYKPFGESHLRLTGGIHRLASISGSCCHDPTIGDRVAAGELPLPPGYGETYTSAFARGELRLDSRGARPVPGSGVFLALHGQPNFDVHHDRKWMGYGGAIGAAVDVTGRQRVIKLQVAVDLVDSITNGDGSIPFTDYAEFDPGLMAGFVPGWLRGRSTAAAQLGYAWPVWIGFDAQTRLTIGNAFDEHLAGLGPSKFRWSWDLGLTRNAQRDQGLELLFGLGSETFDQGAGITSVRVAIGSRQGF